MKVKRIVRMLTFIVCYQSVFVGWTQSKNFNVENAANFDIATELEYEVQSENRLSNGILIPDRFETKMSSYFGLRHLPDEDQNIYLTYIYPFRNVLRKIELGWSLNNSKCMTLTLIKAISVGRIDKK